MEFAYPLSTASSIYGDTSDILKSILAGHELLTEKLLPEFQLTIQELFAAQPARGPMEVG